MWARDFASVGSSQNDTVRLCIGTSMANQRLCRHSRFMGFFKKPEEEPGEKPTTLPLGGPSRERSKGSDILQGDKAA